MLYESGIHPRAPAESAISILHSSCLKQKERKQSNLGDHHYNWKFQISRGYQTRDINDHRRNMAKINLLNDTEDSVFFLD